MKYHVAGPPLLAGRAYQVVITKGPPVKDLPEGFEYSPRGFVRGPVGSCFEIAQMATADAAAADTYRVSVERL